MTKTNEQALLDHIYELGSKAVSVGMDLDFAAKCYGEISRRILSGKSHDCDEYRVILTFLGKAEGAADIEETR